MNKLFIAAAAGFSLGLAGFAAAADPQEAVASTAAQPVSDADKAYQAVEEVGRESAPQDAAREAIELWNEMHYLRLSDASYQFFRKHPGDPRSWEVASLFVHAAEQLSIINEMRADVVRGIEARAMVSTKIPPEIWASFKLRQLNGMLEKYGQSTDKPTSQAAIRAEMDAVAQRAPQFAARGQLEMAYVALLESADPAAATTWLEKLVASGDPLLVKPAAAKLKMAQARRKPLDLKFVALDGRKIDLKKMRGKVVLLDFWATWCEPCVEELPNVKAVYDQYHKQGFEVIGVSADKKYDRKKLEEFVKARQLPWPQYLDEANDRNRLVEELGIDGFPKALLFDKQGLLVSVAARGAELEKLVKELL